MKIRIKQVGHKSYVVQRSSRFLWWTLWFTDGTGGDTTAHDITFTSEADAFAYLDEEERSLVIS